MAFTVDTDSLCRLMDFSFESGTTEQQELFLAAAGSLLNFDLDQVPIDVTVSFEDDPEEGIHNEFAVADGSGGSGFIIFRSDAPSFIGIDPTGRRWGMPFFNEVAVHEIAHIIVGNMAASQQQELAELFGTTTETWNDSGSDWVDRPYEGIAETFKDAFLPASLRKYVNRTNHKISISKFPHFRSIFRRLVIEGTGDNYLFTVPPDGTEGVNVYEENEAAEGEGTFYDPHVEVISPTEATVEAWCKADASVLVGPFLTEHEVRTRYTLTFDPSQATAQQAIAAAKAMVLSTEGVELDLQVPSGETRGGEGLSGRRQSGRRVSGS